MRYFITLTAVALLFSACGTPTKNQSTTNTKPNCLSEQLWERSFHASVKAENSRDKQEKAKLAQEGISLAEECMMKTPEEAACYYYHAINTGIYYSVHVVGYQTGIKTMIKDCEKVIALDEKFDHAGAHRTIGKIYTDIPETTINKNGITRDLDKAIAHLQKAVQIDSSYPENQIYLAEALLEAGKKDEALKYYSDAQTLIPQWKNHRDYSLWQKLNKDLSKKLK